MRRDELFLADMLAAADAIAGFISGRDVDEFERDDMLRSAVLQKLTVIGEAAARLTQELRNKHPAVPWRDIVAFRNIAVHHYFGIDWQIVWHAATVDVPILRREVSTIIAALSDGE